MGISVIGNCAKGNSGPHMFYRKAALRQPGPNGLKYTEEIRAYARGGKQDWILGKSEGKA